jgi:hypothetical protein
VFFLKIPRRKQFITFVVIVYLLLLAGPFLFSSVAEAKATPKDKTAQENQVKIHGDDTITIVPTDSFHPYQYYKAVNENLRPIKMTFNTIDASKPGHYELTLSAKNKQDYDERKVSIIVEEATTENKAAANQVNESSIAKPSAPEPSYQAPVEATTPTETQQKDSEGTQEAPPQPEQSHTQPSVPPQETPHEAKTTEPPVPETPAMPANQISFLGYSLPYQNAGQGSGQGIIDGGGTAATWGGSPIQSGSDNQNTHFIGHNPGVFSAILSLSAGQSITVTDQAGNAASYVVTGVVQVDDSGRDIHSGQDHWGQITSAGGGERITLQTCLSDTVNQIVFAQG